jgi:2-oxoglutarate ferredoxin oxidoreductase subunit alpha
LLSDEIVAHTRESIILPTTEDVEVVDRIAPTVPPEWYQPYEDNSRGVPPMASFGSGYRHHVTGLVHDTHGFPTEKPKEVEDFMSRQFRKITNGAYEIQMTRKLLLDDAEIAVIAYGSVARSAHRAVLRARENGIKAGMLQLITLFPFPRRAVEPVLRQCRSILVPEMNVGQISREVKRVNLSAKVSKLNKMNGQGITPDEIYEEFSKM